MKDEFNERLQRLMNRKKNNSVYLMTEDRYEDFMKEIQKIKSKWRKNYDDYKLLANYDILEVNGKDRLIKRKDESGSVKFYVATNELFGVLHTMHLLFHHADKDTMDTEIKSKYCNISKEVIKVYLSCCKTC